MRFLRFLTMGEVVFAGFILSSVFKAIFDIPIDLTAIFMVWSILIAIKRMYENPTIEKKVLSLTFLFIMFSSTILLSLLYTPVSAYAMKKAFLFVTLTAWSFVGVFILIRDEKSLHFFMKGLLVYSLLTSMYVIFDYFSSGIISGYNRVGIGGSNSGGLARLAGIGSILILVLYFYAQKKIRNKIIPLSFLLISIITLLLAGSRAPLIAFFISFLILIAVSFKLKKVNFNIDIKINKKLLSLLFIVPIFSVMVIPFYKKGIFYTAVNRLFSFFNFGNGPVDEARSNVYDFTISMWTEKPILGNGIGSFPIHYWGVDKRDYPHNIFLESLSELGIIGLIFLIALFIISALSIFRAGKNGLDNDQIAVVLVFIFLFLNSNVSGDFNDNRILFTFIALTSMLPSFKTNKVNLEISPDRKIRNKYKLTW